MFTIRRGSKCYTLSILHSSAPAPIMPCNAALGTRAAGGFSSTVALDSWLLPRTQQVTITLAASKGCFDVRPKLKSLLGRDAALPSYRQALRGIVPCEQPRNMSLCHQYFHHTFPSPAAAGNPTC